jgi:integrase
MKIKLKGVRPVRTKNKAGKTVEYWYYGRGKGAVSLPGQPGSAEFMAAYYEASKGRVQAKGAQITLSSVLTRFKGTVEFTGLKPRTKEDYIKHIDRIGDKFGSMPVTLFRQTNAKKINGLFLDWKDKLAAKSVRQADYAMVVLNRVLNIASQRGWIEVNPIETVKRTYKASRQHILWEREELTNYYATAPEHLILPILIAEWTGQRQGDILKMRLSKTDGLVPWYDGTYVYLRSGKTDSFIRVRAVAKLREALDREVERALAETPEQNRRRDGHILVNSDGLPWTENGFRSSFGKTKGKVRGKTFHDLRGTAITRLAKAGCNELEIAVITGHSPKTVSEILRAHYLGADAERAEIAIQKLERFEGDAA